MGRKAKVKRRAASTTVRCTTMVAFTAEDLTVLAKVLAVGQAILPTRHSVFWRLKAAMTRMGVVGVLARAVEAVPKEERPVLVDVVTAND